MTDDLGPLFSPGQYDLMTIDKPEKQRKPRPEAEIVAQLRLVFSNEGDRTLYQVAHKLYLSLGAEYTRRGLDALAKLPGWTNAILKHGVPAMTQVTRIEQAACASDELEREAVHIMLEMGKRQALLDNADQELVLFLQQVHTAHPAMRKQIKAAAESVLKTAFKINPERAPLLVGAALEVARKDTARLARLKAEYRVPKETAAWLTQILVRL